MFFLFLWLGSLDLEAVQLEVQQLTAVRATANQGVLAGYGPYVLGWDKSGSLQVKLRLDGNVNEIFEHDGRIWVTRRGENHSLDVFDAQGKIVATSSDFLSYVARVDEKWFGFLVDQDLKIHTKHRYTYLAQELEFAWSDARPIVRKKQLKFFKINDKHRKFHLAYKKCWLAHHDGTWYAMNQLEPRVYVYTSEDIYREHEIAENLPGSTPFLPVPLKGYVAPPPEWFPFSLVVSPETGMKVLMHWLTSWSEILYFGKVQNGYLIGYTIPTHRFDDRLTGNLRELPPGFEEDGRSWALQVLDREMVPVGGPRYLEGSGLFFNEGEKVFFFELNRTENGIALVFSASTNECSQKEKVGKPGGVLSPGLPKVERSYSNWPRGELRHFTSGFLGCWCS